MYQVKEHKFSFSRLIPIPVTGLKIFCSNKTKIDGSCIAAVAQKNPLPINLLQIKILNLVACIFLLLCTNLKAQTTLDRNKFFADDQPMDMIITSDFNGLIKGKFKKNYRERYQPAIISITLSDSTKLQGDIQIRPRGKYRREECTIPPLMVNFKTAGSAINKLGSMKLVWPCAVGEYGEQLVLKEYLVYKIFNLITEKSFRVRLVKIKYQDTQGKFKPRTFYGFFIEDVDAMASRNNCKEIELGRFNTEATNREQATFVTLFEYMIGNCDWAIPIYRNIKLVRNSADTLSRPFAVPYDFDYSGLVNAPYAIPPLELPITSVQERYYLGFSRTMEELQHALQIFRNNKNSMDSLIANLPPLENVHKKDMIKYLDDFFNIIKKQSNVEDLFIVNARKQ